MTLNLTMPPGNQPSLKPRITVFGVGGAGGNAVNNMIGQSLDGCEFVVANTDAQALAQSKADSRIQMGVRVTEGLGAGARPDIGASAAEESLEDIVDHLAGVHMVFITAGMGGGTGTGAAPIIAQSARELGVLTVGVVTKPFQFEGVKRMHQADEGIERLQKVVDTLIIIPNQNLFRLANEKTTFAEAFAMADDVLYQGVRGVTDLMVRPGLINLDFADVRTVMNEMGKAMMGTGEAEGEERAVEAAEKAIANPLLDEISLSGARGVLINITGGNDIGLFDVDSAASRIRKEVDPEANFIFGSTFDSDMGGRMRVSVVATGIGAGEFPKDIPVVPLPRSRVTEAPAKAGPDPVQEDAPAAMDVAELPPEPRLFKNINNAVAGDVPAPAYQPGPEAPPVATTAARAPEPARKAFVSPRSVSPVTPSPETLARLRAVIAKDTPAAQHLPDEAEANGKPPRFGINSLINRMTGRHEEPPVRMERRPPPMAAPAPADEAGVDPEQERIDIPAFLRRQAN
ncbi:MAG: cell division protein FtsZ [Rhodobacteraceae bacterium]|nr:cell division protein FtsZ [Paracoccaceae bacterium]